MFMNLGGSPALNDKTFDNLTMDVPHRMTLGGTMIDTIFLTALICLSGVFAWNATIEGTFSSPWLWGGFIGGFIVAMIIISKKTLAPILAPVYALLEGIVLGSISAIMEAMYPGIVVQAVSATIAVLFVMAALYMGRIIRPTQKFKAIVISAAVGLILVRLVGWILSMFGTILPIYGAGWMGIGFSVLAAGLASLFLIINFEQIEAGVNQGAPKYMEWYCAFSMTVTLVWLYMEILILLSKLRER